MWHFWPPLRNMKISAWSVPTSDCDFFLLPLSSGLCFLCNLCHFLHFGVVDSFLIISYLEWVISLILYFSWNLWFSAESIFNLFEDSLPYFFTPCQICVSTMRNSVANRLSNPCFSHFTVFETISFVLKFGDPKSSLNCTEKETNWDRLDTLFLFSHHILISFLYFIFKHLVKKMC